MHLHFYSYRLYTDKFHFFLLPDGRGLYIEGKPKVEAAIRNAINNGVFIAFVILDNPNAKDSILDIKVPVFHGPGKVQQFIPLLFL